MQAQVIDPKVVAKEHKKDFEISRVSRFRHRMLFLTDSGIIGSKEFVASNSAQPALTLPGQLDGSQLLLQAPPFC